MRTKILSRVIIILYGVLVHAGIAMNSGHYYSIVKAANTMWYTMDDESVTQSNVQDALQKEAYLLFYLRQVELPSLPKKPEQSPPNQVKKKF